MKAPNNAINTDGLGQRAFGASPNPSVYGERYPYTRKNMFKKLKALFAGAAVATSAAVADGKPPVDVSTPVTNPDLVAAIQRLKTDSSIETKDVLLIELNKANFLVAIFSDEMHTSEPDKDGKVTIEKDSIIKVLNTSDAEGHMYLPLFTDWEAIGKYIDKPVNTLIFPSQDAWHWVLNMGEYHGVVINPAEDALPLSRAQIEYLANEITANK